MAFEKKYEPLATTHTFIVRLIRHFLYGVCLIAVVLGVGMLGYHYFENMPLIDAFLNASMILANMGSVGRLVTPYGKLFAGFYALFCGLLFMTVLGVVFAPVVHRFLHKFHLDARQTTSD